ncbi:hypothetical protein E2F46_09475 [Luteimonas aestuarii]|uniref:Uncharacterized protein n=1 Tax=Luteimonas aestuarii TaxID=453837 RepID=A0A4V6PLM8_9GAMM|nr:hypothetical protein [Luteimonas aestuarii]TDK23754.1 hypothetical protein E2F46_09475 [Luteimonas aestuarii]
MQRMIWGLAGMAALAAAFLLGRYTAPMQADGGIAASAVDSAEAASQARTGPAAALAPADGRAIPTQDADAAAARSMPSSSMNAGGTTRPATTDADRRNPVSMGPQPLAQEDLPKLAQAIDRLRGEGGAWQDLLDLSEAEEPDAEARRLERQIEQSILRHGGLYTKLRLAPPYCTRSVCLLRAVGAGGMRAQSDWQQLVLTMLNEPWFRQSFDDMRTSVSSSGDDVLYVTLFVRCAPGACRLADR